MVTKHDEVRKALADLRWRIESGAIVGCAVGVVALFLLAMFSGR